VNLIANTTVSLYRGTETDEYDDLVDTAGTPYLTREPVSILELSSPLVQESTTGEPRVIRTARMRIKATIEVNRGDRVKDEGSGQFYVVDSFHSIGNPAMINDRRVNLRWQ